MRLECLEDEARGRAEKYDAATAERRRDGLRPPQRRYTTIAVALDDVGDALDLKHRVRKAALERLRERVLIDDVGEQEETLSAQKRLTWRATTKPKRP